ncbi:hypothetical protein BH23BAC1_BH23BAC1_27880 [soil metagenome]
MEYINMDNLKELANIQADNCVSIYIPTHRTGREVTDGQDQILLKNQLQMIKNQLVEKGMQEVAARQYLQPIQDLLDDTNFWRHQSDGLAIFLSEGYFKYLRLPVKFDEYNLISHSFHLTQLLPLLNGNGLYYILALSLNKTKLFRASRDYIEQIDLGKDVPDSLEESMKYTEIEKSVQYHSGSGSSPGGAASGRGASGIFHGQAKGIHRDDRKIYIGEFFRKLNEGVFDAVKDYEDVPLVLVGVDYLHPLYKTESSVKLIYEKGVEGNPDEMHPKEIHAKTWELVEPYFNKTILEAKNKYQQLAGTGKTSYDLKNIVPAAVNGRVEAIFVAKDACQWGSYKEEGENLVVEMHDEFKENDDCLVSMSAITTVLNGGKTFVVDKGMLPEQNAETDVVAVYRY